MSEHTPGLLTVHRGSHEWQILCGEKPVAQVDFWKTPLADAEAIEAEQKANAERLVHCWNHHDKLVAALQTIADICCGETQCKQAAQTALATLAQCKPQKDGGK